MVTFVALAALHQADLGDQLETGVATRIAFAARDAWFQPPHLAPNLKILIYDDRAAERVGAPEFDATGWAHLFTGLTKTGVRLTVVDKVFALPSGTPAAVSNLRDALSGGAPVMAGAFILPQPTLRRPVIDLNKREYSLQTYRAPGAQSRLPWLDVNAGVAYGPHKDILDSFRHVGQIVLGPAGRIWPLARIGEDAVMPHLATFVADKVTVDDGGLEIDGHPVPVDRHGRLVPNLMTTEQFYTFSKSLDEFYDALQADRPLPFVGAGDVVVVLPNLFTGSTDFVEVGGRRVPGGLVVASLVNSVLTQTWVRPVDFGLAGMALCVLLGAMLGALLRPALFATAFMAVVAGAPLLSSALFANTGVLLFWTLPFAGLCVTALATFTDRLRLTMERYRVLRATLDGAVGPRRMPELMQTLVQRPTEASEQVVTLMFIDIVGFSLAAETQTPREAFAYLKVLMSELATVVHEFDGIVDRTLGDGMLCYFGYQFAGGRSASHADQAINCAREIQRRSVQRCIAAKARGEPVFPLRIGMNTAATFVGDLGDARRVDVTVIGHGVNLAQRLEAACDSHLIMLSSTTLSLSSKFTANSAGMHPRLISVKHQPRPLEAFEYDPHADASERLEAAIEAHRAFANLQRAEERWPVRDDREVTLRSNFGEGRLIDFSLSGLAVELPSFLAKGLLITLTIAAQGDGTPTVVIGEVRWGRVANKRFLHGVRIKNLDAQQSELLFRHLQASVGKTKVEDDKAA